MSQYVGKQITITNTQRVRYVGTLASVSAETSSLVLHNVKIFGTESRVSPEDGILEVSADPTIHEKMVFSGSDVSDLQVLENQRPFNAPPKQPKQKTNPELEEKLEEIDDEDFVARTQMLAKDKEEADPRKLAYNKSASFFDDLQPSSSSARPRQTGRRFDPEKFRAGSRDNYRGNHRNDNYRGGRDNYWGDTGGSRKNRWEDSRDGDERGSFDNGSFRGGRGGRGGRGRGRGQGGRGGRGGRGGSRSRGDREFSSREFGDQPPKEKKSQFTEFIPGGHFS